MFHNRLKHSLYVNQKQVFYMIVKLSDIIHTQKIFSKFIFIIYCIIFRNELCGKILKIPCNKKVKQKNFIDFTPEPSN